MAKSACSGNIATCYSHYLTKPVVAVVAVVAVVVVVVAVAAAVVAVADADDSLHNCCCH